MIPTLSNINQVLLFTVETVHFFSHNPQFPFEDVVELLKSALSRLLVHHYEFLTGRLRLKTKKDLFDIDCNAAGALFVVANSELTIEDLNDLTHPNPAFKQFLLHGAQDGFSACHFLQNMASLAVGLESLAIVPYNDLSLLKAHCPPRIEYDHPDLVKLDVSSVVASFLLRPPSRDYVLKLFSTIGRDSGAHKIQGFVGQETGGVQRIRGHDRSSLESVNGSTENGSRGDIVCAVCGGHEASNGAPSSERICG